MECEEVIERRKRKCYIERPTRAKREEYEIARKEGSRIIRKKKRSYLNAAMLTAGRTFRENNCREAYRGINTLQKGVHS